MCKPCTFINSFITLITFINTNMESFKEFTQTTEELLIEMPHIMFDNGDAIDLELEVHSAMRPKEYVRYFKDWIAGKTIKSKRPGFDQKLTRSHQREFAKHLLYDTEFVKLFTIKHYGEKIWAQIVAILEKFL